MRFTTKASSVACGEVVYETDETGIINIAGEHLPLFAHQIAAGVLVHAPEAPLLASGGIVNTTLTAIVGNGAPELFIPSEPSPWPDKPAESVEPEDPKDDPDDESTDTPEGDAPTETDDESAANEPDSESPADPEPDAKATTPTKKAARKKAK